jgi:hypothetical protein
MINLVAAAAQAFAPWQAAYSDSTLISTSVTTVHVVSLVFGAGLAIAADRATLRNGHSADDEKMRVLSEIKSTHRPVLIALSLMFISGAALAAADIKTFAGSPIFWLKLGLVALLLRNGFVLERTETSLRKKANPQMWKRMRMLATLSIALWTATIVAGTALVNA